MSDVTEIGSYEREVLAALQEVGKGQRDVAARVGAMEAELLSLKQQMTGSLMGLSQRVVSLEDRVRDHGREIGALQGESAGLTTRVTATERQAATATGRPLWILAGVGAIVAIELLALLVMQVLR